MSNEMQQQKNVITIIREMLTDEAVQDQLKETLGKRGGAFGNSILNLVRQTKALQACDPRALMTECMKSATMNLPIDPVFGQAAIVPYKSRGVTRPQLQIMYKGWIQLCIRSGQYKEIHCSEIYRDELKSHNPITGTVRFNDPTTYKMRDSGDHKNVVGHYAQFVLLTGFEKSDYMTCEQAMAHAEKYSKAYQYDLKEKKAASPWSTDPIAMGNKTILLRLLKKYGVMSIDMQDVLVADNTFDAAQAESEAVIGTKTGSEPMDTEFEEDTDPAGEQESGNDSTPDFVKDADGEAKAKAKADAQKKKLAADEKKKAKEKKAAGDDEPEKTWTCKACFEKDAPKVHFTFAEPGVFGKTGKEYEGCPKCYSPNIENSAAFDK